MVAAAFMPFAIVGLLLLRWAAEAFLLALNRRHALAAAARDGSAGGAGPRAAEYTAAKERAAQIDLAWSTMCLGALLMSGVLPWSRACMEAWLHPGIISDALWIFAAGWVLAVADLPLEWRRQFVLEQKFGFNTSTQRTWWLDQLKSLALTAAIGIPLLMLILRLFAWAGPGWWWRAWAALMAFQWLLAWLAPVVLLPMFNKLTPLDAGELRDRLLGLGTRAGFSASGILVMDGSKRSLHANAFFTGFGRLRRIVLFDTLIGLLAHEIGHFKRGHVKRMLLWNAAASLIGFAGLAWLARQPWFAESQGFGPDSGLAPTLLLFALLSGPALFWLSPITNYWSRRHEYEADAFAARLVGGAAHLVAALRKLAEKSLTNPHPHPFYSAWHYSHPTVEERAKALAAVPAQAGTA
jgi:STE24 endopeptidase